MPRPPKRGRGWPAVYLDRLLVTTKRGAYPHTDPGVEVGRLFRSLRSPTNENFNARFKGIFDCEGQVPTRGLIATRRHVLGLVGQRVFLHCFEATADLRVGSKPLIQTRRNHDRVSAG